jgi:hypothetical protein
MRGLRNSLPQPKRSVCTILNKVLVDQGWEKYDKQKLQPNPRRHSDKGKVKGKVVRVL